MSAHVDRDLDRGDVGWGRKPALIVVDMSYGFTSPESPLGGDFSVEVEAAAQLVAACHRSNVPVFLSSVVYPNGETQSVFRAHLPDLNILKPDSKWVVIDARLSINAEDTIVEKTGPSAFFATDLAPQLNQRGCDCVMICGLTTSGCVRATVVDALHYNIPSWVISEACGDRNRSAHAANLHDMNAKYADVKNLSDALEFLANLQD